MDAVNDRLIQEAGTPDCAWLPWLAAQQIRRQIRARIRRVSMASLCPDHCTLVVVAPHPDDEVLACGGLLAMRAARGLPSMVVAVTDGEASHSNMDPYDRANLGARRAEESYAGLLELGVSSEYVVRLGIADGNAAQCIDEIALKLAALIQPSDVVLTTWCVDGHPDHEAVSQAAMRASTVVGCRLIQAPVWMWHWAEPDDARVPWDHMVAFDLHDDAITAKQRALGRHCSQLGARGFGLDPVLVPSIVERASRAQEYFFE